MTISLLNIILNNILNEYLENKVLSKDALPLVTFIKSVERASDFWHIEEVKNGAETRYILWRKKAWLASQEHIERARQEAVEYNRILDQRKETFNALRKAICVTLDMDISLVDDRMIIAMAEKLMRSKKESVELIFGVNVANLQDLPSVHIILNERGHKLYEL